MTQYDRIAEYIDKFGSITPMEAFSDLGITKLSTRIGEMTRHGFNIKREMVTGKNRFGDVVRYMRYSWYGQSSKKRS